MRRPLLLLTTLLTLGLVLAACSGGAGSSSGEVRTIAVRMYDMRYDPTEFDFFVGERVLFEVTNAGAVRHELFIGDVVAHEEHAAGMAEVARPTMGHDEASGVSVEPGATETLEYTFSEGGALLAGCHEPGHYEAGMVADITGASLMRPAALINLLRTRAVQTGSARCLDRTELEAHQGRAAGSPWSSQRRSGSCCW